MRRRRRGQRTLSPDCVQNPRSTDGSFASTRTTKAAAPSARSLRAKATGSDTSWRWAGCAASYIAPPVARTGSQTCWRRRSKVGEARRSLTWTPGLVNTIFPRVLPFTYFLFVSPSHTKIPRYPDLHLSLCPYNSKDSSATTHDISSSLHFPMSMTPVRVSHHMVYHGPEIGRAHV